MTADGAQAVSTRRLLVMRPQQPERAYRVRRRPLRAAPVSAWALAAALALVALVCAESGHAQPSASFVDRAVVRFTAPETGGIEAPRFIFERELAFEARLEALADPTFAASLEAPYLDRHVRAALERHMAEVLLESLEIAPEPTPAELDLRRRAAALGLAQQVGGHGALDAAAQAEGIGALEIGRLLQRRARASLYLDRMVATMLTPSDTELRIVHRTTRTPFSAQPYEEVAQPLQRWYVAQRLNAAVRAFYEGARSRLVVNALTAQPHEGR